MHRACDSLSVDWPRPRANRRRHRFAWVAALFALGAFAAGCGGDDSSGAANGGGSTIEVGVVLPLTGNAAAPGADERAGWELALKEAGGKVNGSRIQTHFADAAGDPNQGLQQARNMIEQRDVDVFVMPIFANVALAVRNYIGAQGVPAIQAVATCYAETEGFSPAPNIVNAGDTCDRAMLPLGKYVADQGHKRVTTIGMDYAFGWEQIGAFMSTFKNAGGSVEKAIWAPINTPDWAPYLSQIPKDTDAVVALMAGAQGPRFLKSYREFGLKDSTPLYGGGTMTDFLDNLPPQDAVGVVTAMHYADGLDTPENQAFVEAFKQATGRTPSYEAEAGYTAAKFLVEALKQTGGDASDRDALIKALKETTIEAPRGPVKIDPETLSPIQNEYIRELKEKDGALTNEVIETYENVNPWYDLPKEQWEKQFFDFSRARP
jgi:branched-chain amino acid transport system substrate-binding protein